jgi:hypothetical protein
MSREKKNLFARLQIELQMLLIISAIYGIAGQLYQNKNNAMHS